MTELIPVPILSEPGVKRDGTLRDNQAYQSAKNCRWYLGRPKKRGGWRCVTTSMDEISRGLNAYPYGPNTYIHSGGANKLLQFVMDMNGNIGGINDRTPAAFVQSPDNLWQFDTMFDSASSTVRIIAHAGRNLTDIANAVQSTVWFGDVLTNAALTTASQSVSGGCAVFHPYLVLFDNNGFVKWSVPNKPDDFSAAGSGNARITAQKLIRGLPLRAGAGNGPSGLIWGLDSLVRMSFVGGTAIFNFDTLSSEISPLCSMGIIEYDGIYYWPDNQRFMAFNGVVQELPNDMNLRYFFDNLNYTWRQKVYAYKIPAWGEIRWAYPRGTATECTHEIIYNVREKRWYDDVLDEGGRSAAVSPKVFQYPLMTGVMPDPISAEYKLWQHEFGVDVVVTPSAPPTAIESYFQTGYISQKGLGVQDPKMRALDCERLEFDAVQSGAMTMEVRGQANSKTVVQPSSTKTILQTATGAASQTVTVREERNEMSFYFESNTQGGDYYIGVPLAYIRPGSGRITS